MFIEHNSRGAFLSKKITKKKISTKIDAKGITPETLTNITQKECSLLFQTEGFENFEKFLHNKAIVKNLIFQSKLILNTIEIIPITEKNSPLQLQGQAFEQKLTQTFPREFIYHSNNIEGSKIPKTEIEKIAQNKKLTYKIKNEIQEVKNSIESRNFLQSDFIWNIANIKKLYTTLTKGLLQENGNPYPKGFKKVPIVVNNETTVVPEQVEQEI